MKATLGALLTLGLCVCTTWAGTITVDVNDGGCVTGSGQPDPYAVVYCSIQDAIDDALAGDTISVAAGTYTEPLNIEGRSNLAIVGVSRDTVIIQPTSTLDWGSPYGGDRQVAVRVYTSTDITLSTMTLDFSLVTDNLVHGVLYWDSTGVLDNNLIENMSLSDAAGYYYEITSYFRAPSYTDEARAEITISDNEFVDTGRLGVVTHQFVDVTITGNTFYKISDDFGYAIELGSESTGSITHNTIYGYDTTAASDGSSSAGVYIENMFTTASTGITKDVSVFSNEIYDCEYGVWIGNGLDGYAGDVDIDLNVWGNYIHDNLVAGILVQDEDMSDGSSVIAAFRNNRLVNNGDVGYFIYTLGDGEIIVSLEGETIIGHDVGVYLNDYASESSTSIYDVMITNSAIDGITGAVVNDYSGTEIGAELNWWGDATGPLDTIGTDEAGNPPCYTPATMINADGLGDVVSEYVDYCPWLTTFPARLTLEADADCYSAGDTVTVEVWMRDIAETIVGGQFFLEYDNSLFDYVGTAAGDPPFTTTVFSSFDEGAGTIDYAAGLSEGGSGTSDDTVMAVFTFQALEQICAETNLVSFRAHTPPSRLGDDTSTPVYPMLVNLDVLDTTAPTATQGTIDTCYQTAAEAETAALAATTDPNDNCSDPIDLVLTAATVGDCDAAVTVTVTDDCGNSTDYVYDTRIDNTPPAATPGAIDACYATAAEAEAAAIAATTAPTDNCSDAIDIVLTAATAGDCAADVTVTVTDECGNFTEYVYQTRVDDTAPTATQGAIDACYVTVAEAETAALAATTDPADNCTATIDLVITAATVGDCAAAVTVTVTDECGNSADVVYNTRIDNTAPSATQGAVDACYATAAEAEAAAIAATDPTDNCSDPNDISLSAATVGDCSAVVTVTVTDECGNFTDYDYNTRVDNTPPTATAGTIDACYATAGEAEAAAIAATTAPVDNCSDPIDIVLTAATVGDCAAVVTVTVTDECGNATGYDYDTRIDSEDPVVTPPPDVDADADAGLCTATVDPGSATAVDNCTAAPAATGTRDDALLLTDPYPQGVTTITWEATDECGNTGSAPQTITVSEYSEAVVDIELKAISEATLTRCITLEFWNCTTETYETVEQEITFTSGLASAVSVEVPCGVYDCVRARDGLHSLWRTDFDGFGIVGTQYAANFTDDSGGGGDDDSLIHGNLFDDVPPYAPPQFIDIMDYAVFINNWAVNYGTGDTTCATSWPHADISGDGEVTSADFTFIQTYFLYTDELDCCGLLSGGGGGPRISISVVELNELGLSELATADLNDDGWVDDSDVAAFINGARPNGPGLIEPGPSVPNGGTKIGRPGTDRPRP